MIKFDFKTYVDSFIVQKEFNELMNRKKEIIAKLKNSDMSGWTHWSQEINPSLIEDIENTAKYIKENFDCLVVIGIGGSFLGSYAFDKIMKKDFCDKNFEIIYTGRTLSSKHFDELINYLNNKNFCIDVISKSGTTMETNITYNLLKDVLKEKYGNKELAKHIIVTTNSKTGKLRKEADEKNYKSFEIPDNIGGRYSFITPAHLLPLAINYNIKDIVNGYYKGKELIDEAFEYAVIRNILYKNKKMIELFCMPEENMSAFAEWLKQLFGETEGKNDVGIFPASTINTRDLHSIGQFIQEGNKIIFETFIKIKNSKNYIAYKNKDIHTINNIVLDSVMKAHYSGGVPCLKIEIDDISNQTISQLIYFFQISSAFSGYLFEVDPFNQPGVEVYKDEVKKSLKING